MKIRIAVTLVDEINKLALTEILETSAGEASLSSENLDHIASTNALVAMQSCYIKHIAAVYDLQRSKPKEAT